MYYIRNINISSIAAYLYLLAFALLYLYIVFPNDTYGWITDSAWYLLMADYYASTDKAEVPFYRYIAESNRFPPLYPWILGKLGAGSDNIHSAHIITTIFIGGGFLLNYCWLRSQQQTLFLSLVLTSIFIALPITLFYAMYVMSEALYIFLVFMLLIIIEKSESDSRYLFIVAILIGLITLTRSIGLALFPAFMLYLFSKNNSNKITLLVISAFPLVLWAISQSLLSNNANYFLGYLTYLKTFSIDVVIGEIINNVKLVWVFWIKCFDHSASAHARLILSIVSILSFIGLLERIRNVKFDAYYFVFYLGIIVVWPASSQIQRFLFVIIPLFLFYGVSGSLLLARWVKGMKVIRLFPYVYCLLVILTIAPTTAVTIKRLNIEPKDKSLIAYTRTPYWLLETMQHNAEVNAEINSYYIAAAKEIAKYVPEDQCVYSVWSELVMLYSRRVTKQLPLPDVSDEVFERTATECQYYFMIGTGTNPIIYPAFYPLERIKSRMTPLFMTNYKDKDGSSRVITILSQL